MGLVFKQGATHLVRFVRVMAHHQPPYHPVLQLEAWCGKHEETEVLDMSEAAPLWNCQDCDRAGMAYRAGAPL